MNLKAEIAKIKYLLDEHILMHPNHKESCLDLKERFNSFEKALQEGEDITDFLYWCKWFAPRIIYDGIGDKHILEAIELLNQDNPPSSPSSSSFER